MTLRSPETDSDLLALVREVSLRDFGRPFRHKCRFNSRLRTSGGRYLLASHDLEFNPSIARVYGFEELLGVIRHELCHYHLHLMGQGYRHGDREFQELLAKVGGARYARAVQPPRLHARRHVYVCRGCGHIYRRARPVDTVRFVCGACRGRLERTAEIRPAGCSASDFVRQE
jgi:SprT-like protein